MTIPALQREEDCWPFAAEFPWEPAPESLPAERAEEPELLPESPQERLEPGPEGPESPPARQELQRQAEQAPGPALRLPVLQAAA